MKKRVVFFVFVLFFIGLISADSCSIKLESACGTKEYAIARVSSETNAHVELLSQNNYDYVICCDFGTGKTECNEEETNIVMKISSETNAHAESPLKNNYQDNICYEDLTCISSSSTCPSTHLITVASLSSTSATNSHVGGFNDYTTKICCKHGGTGEYCGACPTSDAYWAYNNAGTNKITVENTEVNVGTTLYMILENSGLDDGTEKDFEIYEDELIRTVGGVVGNDGRLRASWTITQQDVEKAKDGEVGEIDGFYFSVEGENSIKIKINENIVEPEYCEDYEDSQTCNSCVYGPCNAAENSAKLQFLDTSNPYYGKSCGAIVSGEDSECTYELECRCFWNETTDPKCGTKITSVKIYCDNPSSTLPEEIGSCSYTSGGMGECINGYMDYSWTASWEWGSDNSFDSCPSDSEDCIQNPEGTYRYDPLWGGSKRQSEACVSGERSVPCPGEIKLPFFSYFHFIFSLILIGVVYFIKRW